MLGDYGGDDGGDSLETLLQPEVPRDSSNGSLSASEISREVSRDPDLCRHSEAGDHPSKPPPPATVRPSGHATLGVERIVLRGQTVPVETVWTAEVPRSPEDFSVDMRLSNGVTVVVNNRRGLDGRWFIVAKDSSSKGHLLARFQRRPPSGLGVLSQAAALLGSPVSSDISTLLVLLLAVLVTLSPAEDGHGPAAGARAGSLGNQTALDGAGRAVGYWLRVVIASARSPPDPWNWLEPAGAARVADWLEPALVKADRYDGEALLRTLLLLALGVALVGRVAGEE